MSSPEGSDEGLTKLELFIKYGIWPATLKSEVVVPVIAVSTIAVSVLGYAYYSTFFSEQHEDNATCDPDWDGFTDLDLKCGGSGQVEAKFDSDGSGWFDTDSMIMSPTAMLGTAAFATILLATTAWQLSRRRTTT